MSKPILILAVAALLFQDPKPTRNPWAGFPTHSSVVIETETSIDKNKKTIRQQTTIEVSPTGEVTHSVGTYDENGDPPIFFEERKHAPGVDVASFGKASKAVAEDFEVAGKKIACERIEYTSEKEAVKIRARVWRTKAMKVPYREMAREGDAALALDPDIVKTELSTTSGTGLATNVFEIVELDAKLAIDGRDLPCVVEEGKIEMREGARVIKGKVRRWLSDAVPGRVVRSEVRAEVDGQKIERIERVTSFKVAR